VGVCSRTSRSFQQRLAGEGYQFGLADVTDAELLVRCEAAEAVVRALVESSHVGAGSRAGDDANSVPAKRSRLDGEWMDAYVLN